jgi:hypothetical protein
MSTCGTHDPANGYQIRRRGLSSAGSENPTTSARTRELLEWEPTDPGLLAALDEGHYFSTA